MNEPLLPGPVALIKSAYALFRLHGKQLFLILVPGILSSVASFAASETFTSYASRSHDSFDATFFALLLLTFVLGILNGIISILMMIAGMRYVFDASRGIASSSKGYLRSSTRLFWPVLWATILAGLAQIGGFIFFIIPGIIIAVYVSLCMMIVVDGKGRGLAALSLSARMVEGQWWKVFGRMMFLVIPIVIIAGIGSFIGTAISAAFSYLAFGGSFDHEIIKNGASLGWALGGAVSSLLSLPYMIALYESALLNRQAAITEEKVQKTKNVFLGLSIWGLAASILIVLSVFVAIAVLSYFTAKKAVSEGNATSSSALMIHSASASSDVLEYADPAGRYTLSYPAGWDAYSVKTTVAFKSHVADETAEPEASVLINAVEIPAEKDLGMLEDAIDRRMASRESDGERLVQKTKIQFAGVPALMYVQQLTEPEDAGTSAVTNIEEILTIKDGYAYDIIYGHAAGAGDADVSLARGILSSFRFLK